MDEDENVVIISDSDEEDSPTPIKKRKVELKTDKAPPICNLKIKSVTSLAVTADDDDIYIIDDEEPEEEPERLTTITETRSNLNASSNLDILKSKSNVPSENNRIQGEKVSAKLKESVINNNRSDMNNAATDVENIEPPDITDYVGVNGDILEEGDFIFDDETVAGGSTNDLSNAPEESMQFKLFIEECTKAACGAKFKHAIVKFIPKMKKMYKSANSKFLFSKSFLKLLEKHSQNIKVNPKNAILHFKEIYQEMKVRQMDHDISVDTSDVSKKKDQHFVKLIKSLHKCQRYVNYYSNAEVDWDDDNNSAYIKESRYKERLLKIYDKINEYTSENKCTDRLMHRKLDFAKSDYREFNRAIDKFYEKNKKIPTFTEFENLIINTNSQHNLNLSEDALTSEASKLYIALTKLIQRRRENEFHDDLMEYIRDTVDPFLGNATLLQKLDEQNVIGELNMTKLMKDYVEKQKTLGEESGSELGSNEVASDEEEELEENEDDEIEHL